LAARWLEAPAFP